MTNWTNDWDVWINGKNISDDLRPYLISITVTDKDGTESDSCNIEVDDTSGQFATPNEKASVRVALNGVTVFEGIVDKVRSKGSRGSGMTMTVTAKGYDTKGKAKEAQAFHADDATLEDFLGQAADRAGFTLKVDPEFASMTRDYWAADFESFLHLGQRLARELNGTFKLKAGNKAVLAPRGKNSGLETINAVWGDNLHDWDIDPLIGRAAFKRGEARWFDREIAGFQTESQEFAQDRPAEASAITVTPAADQAQAKGFNAGRKSESEREGGAGTVTIDAAPAARIEGYCSVSCPRADVSRSYKITGIVHSGARTSGTKTKLDLKQPV